MADPLEFGSFLLMLYSAGISLYVARKAARVRSPLLVLSLLLSSMIIFHGLHHLFAFLENPLPKEASEFVASILALALAVAYGYVWRRY